MFQKTLCLIKPDAVQRNLVGRILAMIQQEDLRVAAIKMVQLSKREAGRFYAVHSQKHFYHSLCDYMASGPLVAVVLEGDNAIERYRALMGATNPKDAAEGTIRKLYAASSEANSVHGSDSPETAAEEISFFFSTLELFE